MLIDSGVADAGERLQSIATMIGERLGNSVVVQVANDVLAELDASPRRRLMGWLGYRQTLEALRRKSGVPIAMVQYRGDPFYRSMILTRASLAGHCWPDEGRGRRLWLGSRTTLAGWLAPIAALRELGIDASSFFEVMETTSLNQGVLAMLGGNGDYAVTYDRALRKLIDSGALKPSDFSIVWASQPLPYDSLVVSPDLETEARERLRAAVLSVGSAAEISRMPVGYTGFSYASAHDYDPFRYMLKAEQ